MSLLVVGLSHRTAPLELLEKCALDTDGVSALQTILARDDDLNGVVVLATCNRLEVYAGALTFHGALTSITRELARATRVDQDELTEHLYVHYEDRATPTSAFWGDPWWTPASTSPSKPSVR